MTARRTTPLKAVSLSESLARSAAALEPLLEELATGHGDLRDINDEGLGLTVITTTPYHWPPLTVQGRRLQSRLRAAYQRHYALLMTVLANESKDVGERSVYDAHNRIVALIERQYSGYETNAQVAVVASEALNRQLTILDGVHSEHEELIMVPDTNALYWNPALDTWRAPSEKPFLIALMPVVIEELDRHKADRENRTRQQKAERLIRQIGEYRERGVLVDGVPLINNVSRVFATPVYGNPREFFPWLGGSADDYFLAAALSVMRLNPRAPIVILTRDVNLQTKIEAARVSFWLPSVVVKEDKKTNQ